MARLIQVGQFLVVFVGVIVGMLYAFGAIRLQDAIYGWNLEVFIKEMVGL